VGVACQPDDSVAPEALRYVYKHADLFYNFRGLHEFKERFNPIWSPRYLVFPGLTSLPVVGLTLRNVSSGGALFYDYASSLAEQGSTSFDERRMAAAQARAREAVPALSAGEKVQQAD
jgi:phosphatidylglycerol lysyltransferase